MTSTHTRTYTSLIALHSVGYQAGKDTVADFIQEWCEKYHFSSARASFAWRMKLAIAAMLGLSELSESEQVRAIDALKLDGMVIADLRLPLSQGTSHLRLDGREFIINFANGLRRLFGEDTWVNQLFCPNWHFKRFRGADFCLITDLRFNNEAAAVRRHGMVVEVVRPDAQGKGTESETGISRHHIDDCIVNDGTLEDLRDNVFSFMAKRFGHMVR